ncbi:hypothetical protein AB0I81_62495 [Nonomuraea sp. NPDC050404]|uniref:hypothetical protein n=1 Tax=Nonomuraea sp. NPDC050404 TaxID=3155783 RepID=UPI0033FA3C4C
MSGNARRLADELAQRLGHRGVRSEIFDAHGIALVGIWSVGVTVWCEWERGQWRFRWSLSDGSGTGRWEYTVCPCSAMEMAAQRIESLCLERFRQMHGAGGLGTRHRPYAGEGGRA